MPDHEAIDKDNMSNPTVFTRAPKTTDGSGGDVINNIYDINLMWTVDTRVDHELAKLPRDPYARF